MLHSICHQILKTQQWAWNWKRWVFFLIPKKSNDEECGNYHTNTLTSHPSKVMLKILQTRLQQYMNWEIPKDQAGFRKDEEPVIKLPTSVGSHGKGKRIPEHLLLLLWLWWSHRLCGSQQTGKFFKTWEYQTILLASCKTCMKDNKQQNWTRNNGLVLN